MTERDNWFQTRLATKTDTITQFLQLCIYPRVCFTATDAIYAAQFMHVLHQLKTARFSTLICLDRVSIFVKIYYRLDFRLFLNLLRVFLSCF